MKKIAITMLLALASGSLTFASQLVVNGTFETGNLTGWTSTNETGSTAGAGFIATGATTLPQSFAPTVGPETGSFYAVTDQSGPGAHELSQTFTVAAGSNVILSFDMFVNSTTAASVNAAGLDFNAIPNQHARVDILSAGASLFDTGAGVLQNFYLGADPGTVPNPYTSYSFDISSLVGAGGTFQLRFAEVDNLDILSLGIDNVSILANPAVSNAPEPLSLGLMAAGLGCLALLGRKPAAWRR